MAANDPSYFIHNAAAVLAGCAAVLACGKLIGAFDITWWVVFAPVMLPLVPLAAALATVVYIALVAVLTMLAAASVAALIYIARKVFG